MHRSPLARAAVEYPCSDGTPLPDSDFQFDPLCYAAKTLRAHFRPTGRAYVAGNLFVYYEEGNPGARVAPDTFVVLGAKPHKRDSYKVWEEGKMPDFALEILSRSTQREDRGRKRELYASLGVKEYWMFDPRGQWLTPRLQGLRLHKGKYRAMPSVTTMDGGVLLYSRVLGLEARTEGEEVRFRDPVTGQDLLSHDEAVAAHEEEVAAHEATKTKLEVAEAHVEEEVTAHEATKTKLEVAEAHVEKEVTAHEATKTKLEVAEAHVEEEVTAHEATKTKLEEAEAHVEKEVTAREEEVTAHEATKMQLEEVKARLAELEARDGRSG